MKLIFVSSPVPEKCKICQKIDTKTRSIHKEEDNIARWQKEGGRTHSIDKAFEKINLHEQDRERLYAERDQKRQSF